MIAQADPIARHWTREEYYKMADMGLFIDQRTELIEGEIILISPQKFSHGSTADQIMDVLRDVFGADFWVRMQLPLTLSSNSEPEPDVSVVEGSRESYTDHPTTAVLIIEVSNTTLDYDRSTKASLYAQASVQDYWIINLVNHQLEVYRHPAPDSQLPFSVGYQEAIMLTVSDVISPLALPQVQIAVADLLPRSFSPDKIK